MAAHVAQRAHIGTEARGAAIAHLGRVRVRVRVKVRVGLRIRGRVSVVRACSCSG